MFLWISWRSQNGFYTEYFFLNTRILLRLLIPPPLLFMYPSSSHFSRPNSLLNPSPINLKRDVPGWQFLFMCCLFCLYKSHKFYKSKTCFPFQNYFRPTYIADGEMNKKEINAQGFVWSKWFIKYLACDGKYGSARNCERLRWWPSSSLSYIVEKPIHLSEIITGLIPFISLTMSIALCRFKSDTQRWCAEAQI